MGKESEIEKFTDSEVRSSDESEFQLPREKKMDMKIVYIIMLLMLLTGCANTIGRPLKTP